MLTIHKIDAASKSDVRRFVDLPFRLYAHTPQWVPPLKSDIALALNRNQHPFHEHSEVDFFIASRDSCDVGRIAALENRPFNKYHGTRQAQFYFFECEDDPEAAQLLFSCVMDWARRRQLTELVGPKGLGPFDGYGILVEGFEHRQMMTMMNYNPPSYPRLIETLGFQKEVDFISAYIRKDRFRMPERIERTVAHVERTGSFQILRFKSKRDLLKHVPRIARAYNRSFVHNWEYYPLSDRETDFLVQNLLLIANPDLIKVIVYKDNIVGFLLAFPDISAALQRIRGRLFPLGILRLLVEMRRTIWVSFNGVGILPEFHGRGGNALLYHEMARTVLQSRFLHTEFTQIAETAVQMRRDLVALGAQPYKSHRVYGISL
jgi:hypothetical protein